MSDEEITAVLAGVRSRLDALASINAANILLPSGPQERYRAIIEEAYAALGLWEGMMLLSWSVLLTGIVPLLSRVTTSPSANPLNSGLVMPPLFHLTSTGVAHSDLGFTASITEYWFPETCL